MKQLSFDEYQQLQQRKFDSWERSRRRINELLPGTLYIGGFPDDAGILAQLSEAGVSLLVSATRRTPKPIEHVEIVRIPFEDSRHFPPRAVLKSVAVYAHDWVNSEKGPVMVHCAYGLNRSALISAFIMKELTGWDGEEIFAAIRKRRPGSLHNKVYRDIVRSL